MSKSSKAELVTHRDVTFDEIAKWASDDGHLLEREMLKAVREVVGQAGVKMRIAGLLLARRQLAKIQRLSDMIEGEDGLEQILFAPERLKHMETSDLIRLYSVATGLRSKTEAAYIDAVLNPKSQLTPDPEDLRAALRTDEMIEDEERQIAQAAQANLLERVSQLSDRVIRRTNGVVSEPPVLA